MFTFSKYKSPWYEGFESTGITIGDPSQDGIVWSVPFRFPGQYQDPEDELYNNIYYNWHRWYIPGFGRYNRADPMGVTSYGTLFAKFAFFNNIYSYADNNPIMQYDIHGLMVERCRHGYHGFLCVDSNCWGFYPADLGAIFWGGEAYVGDDSGLKPKSKCKEIKKPDDCCDQDKWEEAILDKIRIDENSPPPYHTVLYNCWHWTGDIIKWGGKECDKY